MKEKLKPEKLGIYLHIPFCEKKCPYCAFNSYGIGKVPKGYIECLIKELLWSSELFRLGEREVNTIYFGGGTPSLLEAEEVSHILSIIRERFNFADDAEVTFEANPASANSAEGREKDYLSALRQAGINRLSIGVQSFDNESLHLLGRVHDAKASEEAIKKAREVGFKNISLDLMLGLPGQTRNAVISDIEKALSFKPEHLSLYLLTLEEGTPFKERYGNSSKEGNQEDERREFYLIAEASLEEAGYDRYETSNFSKEGFYSRHNMKYWDGEDYLGAGAGAHSYLGSLGWGVRWWGVKDPFLYMERLEEARLPVEDIELLNRNEAIREAVMTALRKREGLEGERLKERFGLSLRDLLSNRALEKIPAHFYRLEGDETLSLIGEGVLMADEIAAILTP